MVDLDELERLAREATPGPWFSDLDPVGTREMVTYRPDGETDYDICNCSTGPKFADRHFIAAANPAVILEFVAEVRRLRADNERLYDGGCNCKDCRTGLYSGRHPADD